MLIYQHNYYDVYVGRLAGPGVSEPFLKIFRFMDFNDADRGIGCTQIPLPLNLILKRYQVTPPPESFTGRWWVAPPGKSICTPLLPTLFSNYSLLSYKFLQKKFPAMESL